MAPYDVIVVGAGPAGSTAARAAAMGGASTLLLDRRPELGVPVQCGEFLPTLPELLDLFDVADIAASAYRIPPGTVCSTTHWMTCISPRGRRYRFPLSGQTVSRHAFDAQLARQAESAGAELRHPVGVVKVDRGTVTTATGETLEGRVIIGADGPLSVVARGAGFSVPRTMFRMITATSSTGPPDDIELYFGHFAPGGYAWSFPKGNSSNIGLGVTRLGPGASLSGLLDAFAHASDLAPPADRTRWWVPIGPPPESAVRGNALFAGDAANLVMATNGGGIPTALLSGWDAGTVAALHVRQGVPLREYDRRWRAHLYGPLARAHRIYRFSSRFAGQDWMLAAGMGYIGASGLDAMMRLRWPRRMGGSG
jgi:digeranylgeranylglycerophospholipid reductase